MSAAQYTVTGVIGPQEWTGTHGMFHDYKLSLEGQEKAAVVTQKPTSPAPQQGQQVWLELQQHPKFQDLLKAKRVQPPDQQQGSFTPRSNGTPSHDDATRASIEKQVALKTAVEFEVGRNFVADSGALSAPIDVLQTAQMFFDFLRQP